jgi:hypothetical protein
VAFDRVKSSSVTGAIPPHRTELPAAVEPGAVASKRILVPTDADLDALFDIQARDGGRVAPLSRRT